MRAIGANLLADPAGNHGFAALIFQQQTLG